MKMKWYHYLICICLILAGILSMLKLKDIFNIKSAEYGTAVTIETKNNYSEVAKFDLGVLSFTSDDNKNYAFTMTYSAKEFDGTKNNYTILFNNEPTNNVVVKAGKISSELILKFYDLDNNLSAKAKVNILVEFYAELTKVTLTTIDENNSTGFLTKSSNIFGAVIKVVEKE